MQKITASKALFIKLGEGGEWESECIEKSILKLGYLEFDHELCLAKKWDELKKQDGLTTHAQGARTRHVNQVKEFYEAPQDTLWITFCNRKLWWCFSNPKISLNPDKTKTRSTTKWLCTDIHGDDLSFLRLNGKLLSIQGYRGTICAVAELQYLLNKINGVEDPRLLKITATEKELVRQVKELVQSLRPPDFELLIDLIFRQAGLMRTEQLGKTIKDIDIELFSPLNDELIGVQIKSSANKALFDEYKARLERLSYAKNYFIVHTPAKDFLSIRSDERNIIWTCEEVAEQVVRFGLIRWVTDKAC